MFQKNDFTKSLKEIIDQNVQFSLSTDKKDPKFQDLGKLEESSIVYIGENNQSELNIINYNMMKMSRNEKVLEVPKKDKFFPISGFRFISDYSKGLIYLIGGKTDLNTTTNRAYSLSQVNKADGKYMEMQSLANMQSSRAYHGVCMAEFNGSKYIVAVGGEQTQTDFKLSKDNSDTVSMSSSGYDLDLPRKCIGDCELYDVAGNKWSKLPSATAKSKAAVCTFKGTPIVYSFGGWNGKTIISAIERLDLTEFTKVEELKEDLQEEAKDPLGKMEKFFSAGYKAKSKAAWTEIVVREAGTLDAAPNYRLFSACHSIG